MSVGVPGAAGEAAKAGLGGDWFSALLGPRRQSLFSWLFRCGGHSPRRQPPSPSGEWAQGLRRHRLAWEFPTAS